ncbi:MAG: formylglycine-generating enzyme family protein [Anaerolineaceae bacterium]|nr:formylglycine-generating enzyme family protein [Anaerolineaceae bacterium]
MKRIFRLFLLSLIACTIIGSCAPAAANISTEVKLEAGAQKVSPIDGMVMLYVPAGEYEMGYAGGIDTEKPVHTVYIDAFWIDQTEVTNEKYIMCVKAGVCTHPKQGAHLELRDSSATREFYYGSEEYANYPAIYVNYSQAVEYCRWAGRRLPTEAEWEKAARGTDGRIYPWGNEEPSPALLNYDSNIGDTSEAGAYPEGASPYGAYDMAGNVWEWVSDWYDPEYYQHSPKNNPTGPEEGEYFTMRGGSWRKSERPVRVTYRHWYIPPLVGNIVVSHNYDGFRCAASAQTETKK